MSFVFLITSIAVLILLIVRLKLHAFFALLLVSLLFGLAAGMSNEMIFLAIQNGFGGTLGKVGLVIILGVVIGAFLEHTGAAMTIAEGVLKLVGKKNVVTAMGLVGYVLSIPVFGDSGFMLMNSLNRSITKKAGLSLAATATALALGLILTHCLVPPTPGPIAAASTLNADLALVIKYGLVSAFLGLIAGILFSKYMGTKIYIDPTFLDEKEIEKEKVRSHIIAPGIMVSLLPVLLPLILIVAKSVMGLNVANSGQSQSSLLTLLGFLGEPVIALLIGVFCCFLLPNKIEARMYQSEGWIGESFKNVSSILLITGAGGIFGTMLKDSGIANELGEVITKYNIGIFLPFVLGACLKTAQGSSTVALVTVSAILLPLMPAMGMVSESDKALVVVAIGCGSVVVSHAPDSFFWVVTQMSEMNVKQGYQLMSLGTLIAGSTAMLATYFMFLLLH